MGETGRARLEAELARHYAAQRDEVAPETTDALVAAMVAEDARIRRVQSRRMGTARFVASQVRYIPAWTWAAQAALVALMCVLCSSSSLSTKRSAGFRHFARDMPLAVR